MRDFHKDNNRGGFGGDRGGFKGGKNGRDFGNRGGFGGGRDGERRDMHQATCAKCGRSCEVPFRPTGDKPVYCSDCFKNKDGMSPRRDEGRSFERPSFENKGMDRQTKEEFRALNDKMDKILKLLVKETPAPIPAPKADKPEVKSAKVAAVVEAAIGKKPAPAKAEKVKKTEKKAAKKKK